MINFFEMFTIKQRNIFASASINYRIQKDKMMLKNVLKLSVVVILTACASSSVETDYEKNNSETQRRGGVPSIEEVFKMDTNGDGKLSKSEVKGRLLTDFDKFDTNGDGFITREEFQNAPKPNGGGPRPPRN